MSDAEHLIENAVCALEKHDPYEAYDRFIHWVFHDIVPETIDKLVKEMTEGQG